jgi:uncharacterized membrane protein required for colicin V production
MTPLDIGLLTALAVFLLAGFWFGVVHMIGGIVGALVGALLAGRWYPWLAGIIQPWLGGNENLANIIAFILLFSLITRLFAIAFTLVEKLFKVLTVIPFLKTFDRLLGMALGLVEGVFFLGLAVHFASKFPYSFGFEAMLQDSAVARTLNLIGKALSILLPAAVRHVTSVLS